MTEYNVRFVLCGKQKAAPFLQAGENMYFCTKDIS